MKRVTKHLKHYFVPHEGNGFKPHFFRRKTIGVVALLACAIFFFSLVQVALIGRVFDLAAVLPSVLIDLANQDRDIYNLPHLVKNPILEAAAREKAADMAAHSYFAHVSPQGITPWYWFSKAGYRFVYAGENLAINFSDSADINTAWMNSPGHRANILSQNFTEVGIATAEGVYEGRPTIFVVQEFGKPIPEAPATPPVSATPVAHAETPAPVEPKVVPVAESKDFIAVRNTEVPTTPSPTVAEPAESQTLGTTQYSTLGARLAASPSLTLRSTYLVMALVVMFAILLSLFVEFRRHHGKHLVQGVALLVLIAILAFLYQHVAGGSVVVL